MMSNAKLEKKLYLAKESPEPVFDLSECNIKRVPNVYTTIKVLRKECLYLQNNQLTNIKDGGNLNDLCFLQLLDLSFNKISKLPTEIKYLKNLKVLRLNNNNLTLLPSEIGCLSHLEELNLSSNKLSSLPDSICNLRQLRVLDLCKNNLRSLPVSMYKNQMLQSLLLDENSQWISPPKHVIVQGISVILSYFARECGEIDLKTKPAETADISDVSNSLEKLRTYDKILQDNLQRLEKEKTEKLLKKINSEKAILDQKERELMNQRNQNDKQKFLMDLVAEQRKVDENLQLYQRTRGQEQNKFIKQLQSVESTADEVIKQLLETNAVHKQHSIDSLISSLAEEPPIKQNLRPQQVLESMELLLMEEYTIMKTIEENDLTRKDFINVSTLEESKLQSKIKNLLSGRQDQQQSLINEIKQDTDLQHAALLMLIEKSDYRNIELHNQIALIQNQLSNLTTLELENRRLNMDQHITDIAAKRTLLSKLLMDIFEQQQEYRKQMIEELRNMEYRQAHKDMQNYWLVQYQRLLNFQPNSTKWTNPAFTYELALYGVSHYAPILSVHWTNFEAIDDYSKITDSSLKKIGISSSEDRCAILKAIAHFVNDFHESKTVPSAPELIQPTTNSLDSFPSAPPAEISNVHNESISLNQKLSNECVICMDEQSSVVFLPCGHLCSCMHCSAPLVHCPICRCDITRKMQIFTA